MTDKIMKANGKVMHRSTYRVLKDDYKSNLDHISIRNEFDISIRDRYGPDIFPDEFPDVNLDYTPLYDMYE